MRNNRVGKSHRILANTIWKEYKKTTPPKKYSFANREELKTVVKEIFKVIAERLVENEGGVLIRNFGYFFNWKVPKQMQYTLTSKGKYVQKFNLYGNKAMHLPTFVPSTDMEGWSMDNTFNRELKKELSHKLNNGKKYKMFAYTFKSIIG